LTEAPVMPALLFIRCWNAGDPKSTILSGAGVT
jgi:hypothetical protein